MRVLTLNIWNVSGDWRARRGAIVAVVRRCEPDVVCLQEVVESDQPSTIDQVATVGTQPGPKPESESLDHWDGRRTQAPDLGHRFLAAAQSYADVLQEISDGPEDADPVAGLNDEELGLARAAFSRIKTIGGELRLAF